MIPFGLPEAAVLVLLFFLGAWLGAFLNLCIGRIPRHESPIASWREVFANTSFRPRCQGRLYWWERLPIVGWLFLIPRCRGCGERISWRPPVVELLNGCLVAGLYAWELSWAGDFGGRNWGMAGAGGTLDLLQAAWSSPAVMVHARFLYHLVLFEALMVATFIDFDLKIIPDGVTLPAMAVGVLGGWITGGMFLVPVWTQSPHLVRSLGTFFPEQWQEWFAGAAVPEWIAAYPHWHGLAVSLAGLVIGGGIVWMVRFIGFWVLRQEAMGFGDVVLMAAMGSFIGWQPVVLVFFLAPVCALVVVAAAFCFRRDREIPYGPYLSLAAVAVMFGWRFIWPIADRIFALGPFLPLLAVVMVVMLVACLLAIQAVKLLIGIPLYEEEWYLDWNSADQLTHFGGENVDLFQGRWRQETWPGVLAGRGQLGEEQWRRGGSQSGGYPGKR